MENMMCQSNFFLILHYSAAASLSLFTMKRKMERFAIITFDCKKNEKNYSCFNLCGFDDEY